MGKRLNETQRLSKDLTRALRALLDSTEERIGEYVLKPAKSTYFWWFT